MKDMDNRIYLISIHKKLGIYIYAKTMHPGLLVISQVNDGESTSSSSVFLPDGWIDHDEDDKPFIRSGPGTSTERASEAQKKLWNQKRALPKVSSGTPMPPVKPAAPKYKLPYWYTCVTKLIIIHITDNAIVDNFLHFIHLLNRDFGDIPHISFTHWSETSVMIQGNLIPSGVELMIIANQSDCSFDPGSRTLSGKKQAPPTGD